MNTAFYPGTFDPLTNGHIHLIERAMRIFDHLVVGIGINPKKGTLFTDEERVGFLWEIIQLNGWSQKHISVATFSGLTVNAAALHKAHVIIRGVRSEADYAYEMQMAIMNHKLNPGIETVLLPTFQSYSHISSTLVKEVAKFSGDVSSLVPPVVMKALNEKFSAPSP